MRNILQLLYWLVLLQGCVTVREQNLTYLNNRTIGTSSLLRTDGYFFSNYRHISDSVTDKSILGFFIFQNGIIKGTANSIYETHERFLASEGGNSEIARNDKTNWGCYIISHDTIKIQRLTITQTSLLGGAIDVIEHRGKILNDTTIYLFETLIKKKRLKADQVYTLRKYSSKPDSTNWLLDNEK
ncbi:hypothetical protein QNI16_20715 [Cytophagaceae bacterium YF14B1]|uniref:Lipoprotein n=1 Tax=Xanthocytophaga flava TaxID=3048013 RepID=A0AAE3QP60_9BACT|nr:hypothetical protein [Xanthocytophaga flavus]MDJ1482937.1 hypothetical protein [Xanthocytophaga flavus]